MPILFISFFKIIFEGFTFFTFKLFSKAREISLGLIPPYKSPFSFDSLKKVRVEHFKMPHPGLLRTAQQSPNTQQPCVTGFPIPLTLAFPNASFSSFCRRILSADSRTILLYAFPSSSK